MASPESSKARLPEPDHVTSGSDSCSNFKFSPANLFNVEGLVAVITGGGTGIGLMMATALENNGATVYIVGRRLDMLQKAAKENNRFGRIIALQGDITKQEDLLSIAEIVKARHGYIDLLINNAGLARNMYPHPLPSPDTSLSSENPPSPPASPLPDAGVPNIKAFQKALWEAGSIDDWAEVFKTNVTAIYYTTVAFLELLHQGNVRKQRFECSSVQASEKPMTSDTPPETMTPPSPTSTAQDRVRTAFARPPYHSSQVISISSSGAFRIDSKVLSPSYTLSKSACSHLGKLLANLLAPWGIRSNVLAPGVFPSEMTISPTPGFRLDPNILAERVPARRVGTEEDMAGTILFLASKAGSYVNGAVWLVDGGRVVTIASSL